MMNNLGPNYRCPVHGDQGGIIGVEVEIKAGPGVTLPKSLQSRSHRRYCMACWIDMMDREMMPLAEIVT